MARTHEHFCWRCHGVGRGQGNFNGWWPCADAKCVRPQASECKYHRTQTLPTPTTEDR